MKLFLCLFVLVLSACASPTKVHLYAKYLSKQQTSDVVNQLEKIELVELEVNKQAFPESIRDNAIVYAPSDNSRARVSKLMQVLNELGYPISNASLLLANNHSFTENNVGVFLVPNGTVVDDEELNNAFQLPVINEYGAKDCQDATTLYLKGNQEFLFEIDKWDQQKQDYAQQYIEGQWQLKQGKYLVLQSSQWSGTLHFERSSFQEDGQHGKRQGVLLTPMQSYHAASPRGQVNCSYSISIAVI